MDKTMIIKELLEEVRTNTKLRHRLGMEEGSDSDAISGEDAIGITTKDNQTFFIQVQDA